MQAELIDSMGTDLTVVNAARVSFDKESYWEYKDKKLGELVGVNYLSEKDAKLISYLARNNHWTPFSHCQITLRETVPVFVARQRFKHTVGFTYNEVSRRYVDSEPQFFYPKWRRRADNLKQGSAEEFEEYYQNTFTDRLRRLHEYCELEYNTYIFDGVAPEQARIVLPQSMYTSYYVTGSLAAFARAYKLRSDAHAQKEIQDLAKQWDTIIRTLFPVSWAALADIHGVH